MAHEVRKAPFRCPHCGFVQHEPQHLVSTYCRSCGSHYDVVPAHRADSHPEKSPGLVTRMAQKVLARPPRAVLCYRCGQTHEVSGYARNTICPGCNAAIEMEALTFSSNVTRPVDTRGLLTVEAKGYLNSPFIVCGDGFIEGRVSGTLRCEGTLRLACSGKLTCRISAKSVVIEKDARVEILYAIQTSDLVVHGQLAATIECAGRVHIARKGLLEGKIYASSVAVDRGGTLNAESVVQPQRQLKPGAPFPVPPEFFKGAGTFAVA